MATERAERRLAAILAADVAGYSRLMGADEEGTLRDLKAHRAALVDPKVAEHRGRIVKTTGDGILIEFPSVIEAISCAVAVQHEMAERNAGIPEEKRIAFRIGVNLGDIIVEDGDIHGDGVNIAARLEGVAEPGGVCISEDAFRQVRGKVDAEFADMGEQSLKNIARPLRVYCYRALPAAATELPAMALPLPDKPSLAVLAFQNLSGDPEQEHFADGMVEEITTAISRLPRLFVIARNSSFTYKGRAVDVKQVARELGVRYVLEGSVCKAGNRVRITGQLIDTATGAHIWADRFDGMLDDIFELQDRVASSVVGAIEPRLRLSEIERAARKPTERLDAYDLYLRALAEFHKLTLEGYRACVALLRRALEIDPSYMPAAGLIGWCRLRQRNMGAVTQEEIGEAVRLAQRVIASGKDDPDALWMAGFTVGGLGREPAMGLSAIERAVALNPNSALGWSVAGWLQAFINRPELAIEPLERAMRLSPLDPLGYLFTAGLAYAHFAARRYDKAMEWADRSLGEQTGFPPALYLKVALCDHLGRLEEGQQWVRRIPELYPGLTVATLAAFADAFMSDDLRADYGEGLRKAGFGMSGERVERRLAAILAVDVAGYSRLMGEDEEGTLAALKAIRRELGDPKIAEHRGRIVKTTGDGLLVEFASVIDAVRCAVDVQREMAARNEAVPAAQRIEFRMGINVGDIIIEDGDIFGDGVNIAARLEALAEPGDICVSARVQEDSAGRLDLAFRDLGDQQLKNIARPVRAYAIETAPVRMAAPATLSAPRLSIVVLPFANLSNDPEQEYFADALTEDLTTDLSRIEGMFVIARGTAFTFKGKTGDAKQVGRELGVRYVLEGSVRKLGTRIRINAQLIDAETAAHLWAERFDRDAEDLFAVQDEITSRIAIELNFNLLAAEAAKPTENPTALDYLLRGRAAMMAASSQERYVRALPLLERALALDPQSVVIRSRLAHALAARVMDGTSADAADIERALALAEASLTASPRDPLAHYARAQVLRALGRWEEAVADYEACIAGNRNFAIAYPHLAACRMWSGEGDGTIPLIERAIRLSPRDPDIGTFYARIGVVHLLQSRVDESIAWSEKARPAMPAAVTLRAWLASAYGLAGNDERAASELAEARRWASDDRYSSIARLRAAGNYPTAPGNWGVPKIRGLVEGTYFAGLRKAGMPEE